MESKEIKLTEKFLQELIERHGSTLVGKLMKRFEITQGRNTPETFQFLKSEAKELIYEAFRDFKENVLAFSHGHEVSEFKFISKEKK